MGADPLSFEDTDLQPKGGLSEQEFQDCAFYKPLAWPKGIAIVTKDRSGKARGSRSLISLVSVGRGVTKKEYIMTAQHVPTMMGVNEQLYIINRGTNKAVTPFKFKDWKVKINSFDNDLVFYEVPPAFKCLTGLKSMPLASSANESGYVKIYTPFPS